MPDKLKASRALDRPITKNAGMTIRLVWPLMMISSVAHAATLPLKRGTYVLASAPCRDPAFAAMFAYDGNHFSYPHASLCRSVIRSRKAKTYLVTETCSALGDGTPAPAHTIETTYTVLSDTRVEVSRGGPDHGSIYRRCPAPRLRKVL